jgi:hypothetical protein
MGSSFCFCCFPLFSFFSSTELKAQVSFSDHLLSVVCLLNTCIFDFFFRTAGPILTRLGTKQPWVKGIQNCTNEGQFLSPRGYNSKRVKIHWKHFKIFYRTSRPISIKLCTNQPQVKGIQNCTNQGAGPFQRGDNHENRVESFKNILHNHWANFNQTWHKASLRDGDSELYKWRTIPFPKGR